MTWIHEMSRRTSAPLLAGAFLFVFNLLGCTRSESETPVVKSNTPIVASPFDGNSAGDEREVAGVKLCWCPTGRFTMGSPRSEPERRPGEDQVEVTLTR